MTVLILGGVRSGKSSLGQQTAVKLSCGIHYYIATMIPTDGDDRERIRLHLLDREGMGFQTIEQGREVEHCLSRIAPGSTLLLDSVTSLLMNELFTPENNYLPDETAANRVLAGLKQLISGAANVVFVSDYLFSDALRYDASTESFRSGLGMIHRELAAVCDSVVEVASGQIILHKGVLPG